MEDRLIRSLEHLWELYPTKLKEDCKSDKPKMLINGLGVIAYYSKDDNNHLKNLEIYLNDKLIFRASRPLRDDWAAKSSLVNENRFDEDDIMALLTEKLRD